ncbi:uncharacterized protein K452DRAFT_146138 [Aplosporella prunicola CBS 121167]|uniref:Uncharacterized protein n=1 Tax=Aplosporella prunicola CBS 121167 TaxID=1176127 RepID=A0A6A6BQ69_9PEZI|nr:uncharacterized protein K452DRAFT_146138 [Aplosporella prunicola CBS 121167]KAF2144731.1 hypothetical protein K452DRAFT_146138 [Aplosporella prunicola CBS 121167]
MPPPAAITCSAYDANRQASLHSCAGGEGKISRAWGREKREETPHTMTPCDHVHPLPNKDVALRPAASDQGWSRQPPDRRSWRAIRCKGCEHRCIGASVTVVRCSSQWNLINIPLSAFFFFSFLCCSWLLVCLPLFHPAQPAPSPPFHASGCISDVL